MKIERSISEQRRIDRFGRGESARLGYAVSGVAPERTAEAIAEVFAAAPDSVDGLPKHSAEILRSPGGGLLEIGVNYRDDDLSVRRRRSRSRLSAGDREWRVEIIPRLTQSRTAISCIYSRSLIVGASAPDPGVLIDWNGKSGSASASGSAAVYRPETIVSCVATFHRNRAESRAYIRAAAELVGKVNAEAFHHWNAGEALFLGMTRSSVFEGKNGEELCNMNFRFSIRCGGERRCAGVTLEHVDGWDHLWALRNTDLPGSGVRSIHVSRLYERASFAVLDI